MKFVFLLRYCSLASLWNETCDVTFCICKKRAELLLWTKLYAPFVPFDVWRIFFAACNHKPLWRRIRNCSTLELPCLILFRFCGKGNLVNAVYECGRFGDAKSKPDRMCVHTDRFTSVVFLNRKLNIISFKWHLIHVYLRKISAPPSSCFSECERPLSPANNLNLFMKKLQHILRSKDENSMPTALTKTAPASLRCCSSVSPTVITFLVFSHWQRMWLSSSFWAEATHCGRYWF